LLKRILEFSISLTAIIILLPIIILTAILIVLDSPGSPIFCQKRIGKNGKPFTIFKFRTMKETTKGPKITARNDPRLTKIGRKLKNSSLDELPQLFNILLGQMSIVGPRPEIPKIVKEYTKEQLQTLTVKPGMTGLAQIEYADKDLNKNNIKNIEKYYLQEVLPKKTKIDLEYIKKQSLLFDAQIILKTIKKIVFQTNR
jgi:lipopolysaccharide/colanic/teichoic acid biosynthesis glycosyltransferase